MSPRFWVLLLGQTGALFGSGLTAFALGIWSLQHDHSASNFALLAAAATAPGVLLAPLAGHLAERARPRRVLVLANACAVVATLGIVAGLRSGLSPGAWVYGALIVSGIGFGLQWPVYARSLIRLAHDEHGRNRAAALVQLGPLAQHIAAPAVAAGLVAVADTASVLVFDAALGVLATASACVASDVADADDGDALAGVNFLRRRPAFFRLQLFLLASYTFGAVLQALSTPLLLTMVSAQQVGVLMTLSGTGMVAGVVVALAVAVDSAAGRVKGVVVLEAVCGVCLLSMGLFPSPWIFATLAGLFLCFMTWSNALAQAHWQEAVPSTLQVRVFALRRMISWTAFPLCFVCAGPAADALVDVTGDKTAGLAAVFVLAGVGKVAVSLIALTRRTLAQLIE